MNIKSLFQALGLSARLVLIVSVVTMAVGCGGSGGSGGSGGVAKTSNVSLSFKVPAAKTASSGNSGKAAVPVSVGSMVINITAVDMDTVTDTFDVTPDTTVTKSYEVWAGTARTITVKAYSDTQAAGTFMYKGSTTVDLTGGVDTTVVINMVETDRTPPTVASTDPADNVVDISLNSQIKVTFSEAMDEASINETTFVLSSFDGAVAGSVSYDSATNTGLFTPSSDLAYETEYGALVTVDVTDTSGNSMGAEYSWKFGSALLPEHAELSRTFGGASSDFASTIEVDPSGNIFVAGTTRSFGAGGTDMILSKYDSTGSLLWSKTWGGPQNEIAYAMGLDPAGNIYVTGTTTTFGSGGSDIFVLKYNSSGTIVWSYAKGSSGNDYAYAMEVDDYGNLYIAGSSTSWSAGGDNDAFVMALDTQGNVSWSSTWGGSGEEALSGMSLDAYYGFVYVAGYTTSYGAGGTDALLIKLGTNGILDGGKIWGGTGDDYANAIGIVDGSDYFVTGSTTSFGAGGTDAFLLVGDNEGQIKTTLSWGGPGNDEGAVIGMTEAGEILVAGTTTSFGAGGDVLLLKFVDGVLGGSWRYGGSGSDTVSAMVIDSFGNLNMAGSAPDNNGSWVEVTDGVVEFITGVFTESNVVTQAVSVTSLSAPGSESVPTGYVEDTGGGLEDMLLLRKFVPVPAPPPPGTYWAKTFGGAGGDYAYAIEPTSDGGYLLVGYTYSGGAGGSDILALKLAEDGSVVWQKTYGGSKLDIATNVFTASDGTAVIVADTFSAGSGADSDILVLKIDSNGNVLSQDVYGGSGNDIVSHVLVDKNGDLIVLGTTASFSSGDYDIWILNITAGWQKTYGWSGDERAQFIIPTPDGLGYLVGGNTQSYGYGAQDLWLFLVDTSGQVMDAGSSSIVFGGNRRDILTAVQPTTDGGYIVAGTTFSLGLGDSNIVLMKLNSEVGVIWQDSFGWAENNEVLNAFQQTADGGYILAGHTDLLGNDDSLVIKLDANGSIIWQNVYPSIGADTIESVKQTPDGGFILAGSIMSSSGDLDIRVLKIDKNGEIDSTCGLVTPVNATVVKANLDSVRPTVNGVSNSALALSSNVTLGSAALIETLQCPL